MPSHSRMHQLHRHGILFEAISQIRSPQCIHKYRSIATAVWELFTVQNTQEEKEQKTETNVF